MPDPRSSYRGSGLVQSHHQLKGNLLDSAHHEFALVRCISRRSRAEAQKGKRSSQAWIAKLEAMTYHHKVS